MDISLNTLRYVDILQDLVNSYNSTFHQSIGMAKIKLVYSVYVLFGDVYKKNTLKETKKLYKYRTGDYVRLSLTR